MKKRKRMILFSAKEVLCLLILFAQNETVSANSCSASIPTLQRVTECPKTHNEWMERSAIKRCNMLAGTSQCSSFTYHCLLNQDGNATFEVCAPTWYLSGFCAIYNTDEFRVVDNFSFDCNNNTKIKKEDRCPSRYISTETYKYQICYRKREQTTLASERIHQSNMENRSDTSIWTIVLIVLFILALIASIIQGVFLYRVGCCKLRNKDEKCKTNKPRQEAASHDLNQGDAHQNQFEEDVLGNEEIPLLEDAHQNPDEGGGGVIKDAPPLKGKFKAAAGNQGKDTKGNNEVVPRQQRNPAINCNVSTNTNPKAKNDHEKTKVEREEERIGIEKGKLVQKALEKLGGKSATGDQGKDAKGNNEEVPRQQMNPAINGGKSATGDQGHAKGNNEVVPRQQMNQAISGASLELETSAEGNNLRSNGQNKVDNLGDIQEEKKGNGKVKKEEIEQEHTESVAVTMPPYPIPHNAEKSEMQQDEVNQSTSTDIKEENTDSTNIPSNNPSVEKCSSQE